jgi:branched-chain amino acid transport system ATP-binding protein
MLDVKDINAAYGQVKVLNGVSLNVDAGEILCVMGRNGAGKTTLLKTIMGIVRATSGSITLDDQELTKLENHQIPKMGIGYIPQGRRLFPELTVEENIEIGLMTRDVSSDTKDWVLGLFPHLQVRLHQAAGTLSGGEQQMLATARALALRPKVLMLDEPTEGLQPSMSEQIRQVIINMKSEGFAIILVEQRIDAVLSVADRITMIENGKSVETLTATELKNAPETVKRYLGV